ncbi:MAG: hypothetical protein ACP8RL_08295 [cyanobacterium endosymbiont of Rhopalodia inflata]
MRNASLVPKRLSLTDALKRQMPTGLVFILVTVNSQDCKQFTIIVSRMQ